MRKIIVSMENCQKCWNKHNKGKEKKVLDLCFKVWYIWYNKKGRYDYKLFWRFVEKSRKTWYFKTQNRVQGFWQRQLPNDIQTRSSFKIYAIKIHRNSQCNKRIKKGEIECLCFGFCCFYGLWCFLCH